MWETVNARWEIRRGFVPVDRRGGERGLGGYGDWLDRRVAFVRGHA